jgi:hypothetical protein
MSDLFWIILIIALYWYIIRPMMQGMLEQNKKAPSGKQQSPSPQNNQSPEKRVGDYVDYEEIK